MHLQTPHFPPAAPPPATAVVSREDVLWGRPIFRAPTPSTFTDLSVSNPPFAKRRFRPASRKRIAEVA